MTDAPCVLIVAGSDSSGGAGVVRDIETVAAHGLRSAVAVTAVTVQTHQAVKQVEPVEAQLVADQMEAAFAANMIGAVKIGLVPTSACAAAIAGVLGNRRDIPAVFDPVLAASSGDSLAARGITEAMVRSLLPLCDLVTPNRDELATLAHQPLARDDETVVEQGRALLAAGARAVLAKGGHGGGATSTDWLIRHAYGPLSFDAPRLEATARGTGCTLSSGIAVGLAQGDPLEASIRAAKAFAHARLEALARER